MHTTAYLVGSACCAAFIAYTMRWQGATLFWGQRISPSNPMLPRGSQDAITPPLQVVRIWIMYAWLLAMIIVSFVLLPWYFAIASIIGIALLSGFIGVLFMPAYDSAYFQSRIRESLIHRYRSYSKDEDEMRASLVQDLISDFDEITLHTPH
jgi:hypothetical protein